MKIQHIIRTFRLQEVGKGGEGMRSDSGLAAIHPNGQKSVDYHGVATSVDLW